MSTTFALSFDAVRAWCERQKYTFRANAESQQLAIDYAILGQPAPLMVMPHFQRGMLMFLMRLPFPVPADKQAVALDAAARLNATILMGAWIVNRETGELLFRVTIPALDTQYSDDSLLHVARVCVGSAEKAAPILRSIILDGADPATAIAALANPG